MKLSLFYFYLGLFIAFFIIYNQNNNYYVIEKNKNITCCNLNECGKNK